MSGIPSPAGPVALVGSGEYLETMVEVDRGLLSGRPPRAVFLPTAAGEEGENSIAYWLELGTRHFESLGIEAVPLRVVTREDAEREDLAAAVAGAGLVYLSGGNPGYLARTLRGTTVWRAIEAAWRGGAALAGCSAGACALTYLAEDVRAMRAAATSGAAGATWVDPLKEPSGIALVPGLAVIPHYDRMASWAPGIGERYLGRVPAGVAVVGVDEDTALVSADAAAGSFAVAGRQSAWLLRAGGDTDAGAGAIRGQGPPGAPLEFPSGSTLRLSP